MIEKENRITESICFRLTKVRKTHRVRTVSEASVITSLDETTLDIPAGKCVAVLGYSGSGKSTLLHLLGLLDSFDEDGAADIQYFSGTDVYSFRRMPDEQRNELRRDHFGFVFQNHGLLSHLSCEQNIGLGLGISGQPTRLRRSVATRLLKTIGLEGLSARRPNQLSGGESQRIALLRATAHEPRVLLADEPTGSLDAANADVVMAHLKDWQSAGNVKLPRTLILITHDVARAYEVCDRFVILHEGRPLENRVWHRNEIASPEKLNQLLNQVSHAKHVSRPQLDRTAFVDVAVSSKSFRPTRIRWSYLSFLAFSDLRHQLRIVTANLFTLFLSILLVFCGWGLMRGKTRMMERELQSAGALSLDISANGSSEGIVDSAFYERLRQLRLRGRPLWEGERPVFRWNMFSQQFFRGDQARPESLVDFRQNGRSLSWGDPILDDFDSEVDGLDGRFSSEEAQEIAVTSSFLKRSNYPIDSTEVWLSIKNAAAPLRIVKISERLPGGYSFVIPDGLYQQWQTGEFDPNPEIVSIALKPVAAELRNVAIAISDELLKRFDLLAEPTPDGIALRTPTGTALRQVEMITFAGKIREKIVADARFFGTKLQLVMPPRPPIVRRPPQFMRATLVLNSYDEVIDAGAALTEQGIEHDDKKVSAYGTLKKTIEPLQTLLGGVVLIAAITSVLNLFVTVWLRVAQKRFEIGIMKAFGLSAGQLSAVYVIQGIWLGILALCLALTIGHIAGKAFAEANHDPELFAPTLWMVLVIAAATLLLSTFSCGLATWHESNRQPASAVR